MRLIITGLFLFYTFGFPASAQQTKLSEYEEFKSYPFIEKAYRLQRQGNYQAALTEVEKAIEVAPEHLEFKQLQLQLTLSLMQMSDLIPMFLAASPIEQNLISIPLLQRLLSFPGIVPIEQYSLVLKHIPTSEKTQAALDVDARLIGQQRLQESLDFLTDLKSDEPILTQRRFLLASELGQHQDTTALYSKLTTPIDERNLNRYIDALVKLRRHEEALLILTEKVALPYAGTLIDSFIQRQVGAQNYQLAERGFKLLESNGLLTTDQKNQWLKMRLTSSELTIEVDDVLNSGLSCWQQAEILVSRLGDFGSSTAQQLLIECTVAAEEQQQYATTALSILTVDQLKLVIKKAPFVEQALRKGIINRLIAKKDFQGLVSLAAETEYKELIELSTLALAYQQTNNLTAAANIYYQLFKNTGDLNSLEQATFLWSLLGDAEKVVSALVKPLSDSNKNTSTTLIMRYIDAIGNDSLPDSVIKNLFLHPIGLDAVAEKLRLQNDCTRSVDYILHFSLSARTSRLTEALCLQQLGDQRSIEKWQLLLDDYPTLENLKATVFAMMNAKQHLKALDLIADYPQFQTNIDIRQTKLQALIQKQDYQAASSEWKSQFELYDTGDFLTGAELAVNSEQYSHADDLINQLISNAGDLSESDWIVIAQVKEAVNKPTEALAAWKMVLEHNPRSPLARLSIAYSDIASSPERALIAFQIYTNEANIISPDVWKQMAYLADRLGNYTAVGKYLDNYFALDGDNYSVENENSWALHSLYAQSQRRWDFSAAASHGNGAVLGDVFFVDNQGKVNDNLQNNALSARLSYRLFDDSKRWKGYTQINANGPDSSPLNQQSLELGISYRLFENINLLASAGAIYFSSGDEQLQSFVRLSGDFLNQADWRNGWRFEPYWWERQWYTDVVYLLDSNNIFATSRFDGGYVKALSTKTKQTIKLYGLAQFDYRRQTIAGNELANFEQTSMGLGIQWRLFETPSSIANSASVWSANLEFRSRLSGNLTNDDIGLFITLGYQH